MAGRKDAAWWADYRRRKKEAAQGPHATPWVDTQVDMSTSIAAGLVDLVVTHEGVIDMKTGHGFIRGVNRPAFLAAPDDDCAACHHDRQYYHLTLDGKCSYPTGPRTRCGCLVFIDAAEPF